MASSPSPPHKRAKQSAAWNQDTTEVLTTLGQESLRWALHVPSGSQIATAVKAHQIYRTILSPADDCVVEGLVRGLATAMSALEAIVNREAEQAGNRSKPATTHALHPARRAVNSWSLA